MSSYGSVRGSVSGRPSGASSSACGAEELMPTWTRPLASAHTVAKSSASRNGFSNPSGTTFVSSVMRSVRCEAAASTVRADETPRSRCRWRTPTVSYPRRSARTSSSRPSSRPPAGSASG